MRLFGGKKSHERYVGIDIGTSTIKMVECENDKHHAKLLTYGYQEHVTNIISVQKKETVDEIGDSIRAIWSAARVSTRNVVAALPSYTVFSSIIHLPELSKKELLSAVQWEAKKFVPMPITEMVLDWKILEESSALDRFAPPPSQNKEEHPRHGLIHSAKKKFLRILITAAPKNLVSRYLDIFKVAGLNLVSLETESFALERALVGRDPNPIMLIDVGATATTLTVVVDSVPLLHRSIDVGGNTITKAIAGSMKISENRAEQFKRDFGATQEVSIKGDVPRDVSSVLSALVTEIKYVMSLYQSQGAGSVEKIILAGGSAWLPNLPTSLSQQFGLNCFIGDPWARVMYPVELQTVLKELGPQFAVAIGLSLREMR